MSWVFYNIYIYAYYILLTLWRARNLKAAIRMPTTAYQHLTESHTAEFLVKLAEDVADRTHLHMPPSVVAVAEMLFRRTPMGRFVDILKRAADKKEHERRKKVESWQEHNAWQ